MNGTFNPAAPPGLAAALPQLGSSGVLPPGVGPAVGLAGPAGVLPFGGVPLGLGLPPPVMMPEAFAPSDLTMVDPKSGLLKNPKQQAANKVSQQRYRCA